MFLSTLNEKQKKVFFCLAYSVVVSDGELNVGEKLLMEEMRREMGLDIDYSPYYIDVDGMDGLFETRRSRAVVLLSLIQLGYADGAFEIEEQSYLRALCRVFHVSDEDFALMENWVRRLVALNREASGFF